MPVKTKPVSGQSSWGNVLNTHLEQLIPNSGGGINTFDIFTDRPIYKAGTSTLLNEDDVGLTYLFTQTGNLHRWEYITDKRPKLDTDGSVMLNPNGSAIMVTTSYWGWKVISRENDLINVKDYGALGDNTTDDTDAIQFAIDKARYEAPEYYASDPAGPNLAEVYLPTGQYNTTKPIILRIGSKISGSGKGNSIILKTTNTPGTLLNNVDAIIISELEKPAAIAAHGLYNSYGSIKNLSLKRPYVSASAVADNSYGIYINYDLDGTYTNIRIYRCGTGFFAKTLQSTVLTQIACNQCNTGYKINGATLTDITGCWAYICNYSYDITANYTTLNNCGTDGISNIAYKLKGGLTLNNCGFEILTSKASGSTASNHAIYIDSGSTIAFSGFFALDYSTKIDSFIKVVDSNVTFNTCQLNSWYPSSDNNISHVGKVLDVSGISRVVFINCNQVSNGQNYLAGIWNLLPSCTSSIGPRSVVDIDIGGVTTTIKGQVHTRRFSRNLIYAANSSVATLWNLNDYNTIPADTEKNLPAKKFFDTWRLQGKVKYTGYDMTNTLDTDVSKQISGEFNVVLRKNFKYIQTNPFGLQVDVTDTSATNSKTTITIPTNYCVNFDVVLELIPVSLDLTSYNSLDTDWNPNLNGGLGY